MQSFLNTFKEFLYLFTSPLNQMFLPKLLTILAILFLNKNHAVQILKISLKI